MTNSDKFSPINQVSDFKDKISPEMRGKFTTQIGQHVLTFLQSVTEMQKTDMSFRPTVNFVMHNGIDYIFHKTKKSDKKNKESDNWSLYGGGVDGDDILTAVLKEVWEETGLLPEQIESIKYLGGDLSNSSRAGRDGFKNGKMYFYFEIKISNTIDPSSFKLEEGVEGVKTAPINSSSPFKELSDTKREQLSSLLKHLSI
jgi:8-oxo-dGTP pyrophosphatase MutT (NUDIX family)